MIPESLIPGDSGSGKWERYNWLNDRKNGEEIWYMEDGEKIKYKCNWVNGKK